MNNTVVIEQQRDGYYVILHRINEDFTVSELPYARYVHLTRARVKAREMAKTYNAEVYYKSLDGEYAEMELAL